MKSPDSSTAAAAAAIGSTCATSANTATGAST
jgi:hypothetical protein